MRILKAAHEAKPCVPMKNKLIIYIFVPQTKPGSLSERTVVIDNYKYYQLTKPTLGPCLWGANLTLNS